MKYFFQLIFSLISISFVCHAAIAENQQPRAERYTDAKQGDRFSYVNGVSLIKCNHWEVKEANKNGEIVSKCGDNALYVAADNGNLIMAMNDKGDTVVKFTPFFPELSFPLFVGRKWSSKYSGQEGIVKWTGDMSCEATAFEEIKVAAGKFDAFRIECLNKWDSGIVFIHGTRKSTHWYAPAVHLKVKSINEENRWSYEVAGTDFH